MSKPEFDSLHSAHWAALRSVAHWLRQHPRAVVTLAMSQAGYWVLWPMVAGQLPRTVAEAFIALSAAGLPVALEVLRQTLVPYADRRGNIKGGVSLSLPFDPEEAEADNSRQAEIWRGGPDEG